MRIDEADAAAAVVQMAADLAWHNPTGLFASAKLEALLRDIADQLQPEQGTDLEVFDGGNYSGDPEHVLHVLTTASSGFGPQWLARRWIEAQRVVASQHAFSVD